MGLIFLGVVKIVKFYVLQTVLKLVTLGFIVPLTPSQMKEWSTWEVLRSYTRVHPVIAGTIVILVITVAVIIGKKGHKTQEFIEANIDLEKVLAANEEA